jgi:hypothetical protein
VRDGKTKEKYNFPRSFREKSPLKEETRRSAAHNEELTRMIHQLTVGDMPKRQ